MGDTTGSDTVALDIAAITLTTAQTVNIDASGLGNAANGAGGTDTFTLSDTGADGGTSLNVTGGANSDSITVGDNADTVASGAGADSVSSGGGVDSVSTGTVTTLLTLEPATTRWMPETGMTPLLPVQATIMLLRESVTTV